jgi:cell wall-associated NlpC family hydrolase
MITQLLFGEVCEIITKKHNHWCRIKTAVDDMEGWCLSHQLEFLTAVEYEKFQLKCAYTLDITQSAIGNNHHMPILLGSMLPHYDGISFKMPGQSMRYSGQVYFPYQTPFRKEMMLKIARKYLFAPYLEGGRTPFGVDAGGYIQMVFKIFGISLSRRIEQQSQEGEVLHFVSEGRPGDLAFFEDDDGKIIHGGILINNESLIHSYGMVRIDPLDHYGIFNKSLKAYTHRLRFIKRILPE